MSEWPELDEVTQAEMGSSGATLAAGIAVDDANLYFGGEIHDPTPDATDSAELDLQVPPTERNPQLAFRVHLDGKRGRVQRAGNDNALPVAGARVAVQPLDGNGGATFEVAIPWSQLGDGRTVRAGLRAAIRYHDGASAQPLAVLSTIPPASASKSTGLPPLLIDVEANLADTFLAPRNLVHATPDQDLIVDIAGDGLKERVLLYGPLLVALGPHYRDGKAFDWLDLGARVVHLDVRDATGDGKDDLLVLRQVTTTDGILREAFEILSFAGGSPATVFAHEVRIARDGEHGRKEVVDFVHAAKGTVDVGPEKATGWDASSFDVEPAASMDPILLPWAGTSESYRFDGKKFTRRPGNAR